MLYVLVWITCCNAKHKFFIKHVCCTVSLESSEKHREAKHTVGGGCTGVTIRFRSQSHARHHGQCQEWRHAGHWSHGHTPHLLILLCDFLSSLTSPRVILSRYYQRNAHEMRSRLLLALTDEALFGRCCP